MKLTKDPDGRATMGGSSGGSAAFSMAWYHPELYHRVLTYSGTYVNQQWPYNAGNSARSLGVPRHLIPESPVEADSHLDACQRPGSISARETTIMTGFWQTSAWRRFWPTKGYHYQFVFARNAGHTDRAVKAQTLPEALEYVWQGYRAK